MRPVALAPGMCFDAACQAAMDRAFLTATTIPLLGLAGAVAYKYRPAAWQKSEGKQVRPESRPPSSCANPHWTALTRVQQVSIKVNTKQHTAGT